MAQKNGWLGPARHAAALIYTSHGPIIAELMTYDDCGVTSEGQAIGGRLTALAGAENPGRRRHSFRHETSASRSGPGGRELEDLQRPLG